MLKAKLKKKTILKRTKNLTQVRMLNSWPYLRSRKFLQKNKKNKTMTKRKHKRKHKKLESIWVNSTNP